MGPKVVVVGAGFGGLAASVELARRGCRVVLLERAAEVGGKARSISVGGRSVDVGPTVLTMRWVFDEMFAGCGRSLGEAVNLIPMSTVARHVFADGSKLDLVSDVEANVEAIAVLCGRRDAEGYRRFAAHGAEIARTVQDPFLRASRPTLSSLVLGSTRIGLGSLGRIDAHRTMWRAICSFFEDARLRALFGRYATYVGSSPFAAPATLNLIAHVEREGVVAVDGGISRLARAVAELASDVGVEVITRADVRDVVIEDDRAAGVIVEDEVGRQEMIDASAVVLTADVATIASGAFGAHAAESVDAPDRSRRSLSALTWAITGRVLGLELAHHTIFFSSDYPAEHRALFEERRLPEDSTFYVCAQDRAVGSPRPGEDERLLVIANAPADADGQPFSTEEIERCERNMMSRLGRAGLYLRPQAAAIATPTTFERLSPGTGGAIYGSASHGAMAALSRPSARTRLAGLYLAGGSVHPGPGVPMAALSGRTAATAISEDLASTHRFHREATAGSISMR